MVARRAVDLLRVGVVVAVALCGSACNKASTALHLNLLLTDALLRATASARVIVSRVDGSSFPAASMRLQGPPGLTTRNYDFDGDRAVDVVLEFAPDYAFDRINRLSLVPSLVAQSTDVRVRAEVYDGLNNLLAKLPNDFVPAVLRPGQVTIVDDLGPACIATCGDATVVATPSSNLKPAGAAITAIAAGDLTGSGQHDDLIVASSLESRPGMIVSAPTAGRVRVFLGGAGIKTKTDPDAEIIGAQAGDQLGAALAVGDLDGDGKQDLLIGAPGARGGRGAVWLVRGDSRWWAAGTPIDLAAPPATASVRSFSPEAAGARLGGALVSADLDGDGQLELLASAVGYSAEAGAVYVLRAADFSTGGGPSNHDPALTGRPGSQFGRSLAAYRGVLAVGAPLDRDIKDVASGAVYRFAKADFAAPIEAARVGRWLGTGGGFGTAVGLADLDGNGEISLVAAAPTAGNGVVYVHSPGPLAGDGSTTTRTVRALAPIGLLGVSLATVPRSDGDTLVLGAPYQSTAGGAPLDGGVATAGARAGAALVVRGTTLQVMAGLRLDGDGKPAASAYFGSQAGDGFGASIAVGDFDGDRRLDLAVAAGNARRAYLILDLAR